MGYFFLTFLLLFPYFRKTGKDRKRSKKERAREKSGAPGTARDRGCSVSAQVAPSAPGVWAARCVCRDMSECLWISRRSMAAGLGQLPLGGQSGFSFVLFLLFLLFSYFSLLFLTFERQKKERKKKGKRTTAKEKRTAAKRKEQEKNRKKKDRGPWPGGRGSRSRGVSFELEVSRDVSF